jgi:metabolite-proton symporter
MATTTHAQAPIGAAAGSASERSILKVALTALGGTSIEWYDFFLYSTAAALVFPTVFFPEDLPPLVGLLASFSTFAVGFLARPVGGVIFGHFGDRHGRKTALVVALVMMGAATTLIGCLPPYSIAGAAAPLLLIVLRFVQGLAIGGQWGGAVLIVTESAPQAKRGFYGSFAQIGAPAGVILANLAFLVVNDTVSPDGFLSWGWRVPFLLSVVLIALALWVQLRLEDTSAFRNLKQTPNHRSPVLTALAAYPRQIALAAGAFMATQVTFYILIAFVLAYGSNPAGLGLPRGTMLSAMLIGAVVMIPALLVSAAISDRYGRRGIYMSGALLLALWGFALFPLVDTGSFLWITVAVSIGQTLVAMMYGLQAAFFAEMFSTEVRYSGASLGYQLGAIVGGALAPMIATALFAESGSTLGISVYIAVACGVSLVSVWLLTETYRNDLHGT